jgi:arsenite/tail-anchored protein-transporting ATPase
MVFVMYLPIFGFWVDNYDYDAIIVNGYCSTSSLLFNSVSSCVRLIIYTGKGGTGKTVTSCSTAVKLAKINKKTIVISADPAHTLNDAFMITDIGTEPKKIAASLYALQVDPVVEMNKQYGATLSNVISMFSAKGIDESLAYEVAMLPGMTQLFSLLKIDEIIQTKIFDSVVLDMPASGEALRYLYFPKLVGSIGRKLSGLAGMFGEVTKMLHLFSRSSNTSRNILQNGELLDRLDALSNIIRNTDITSLRLVANPDTFSIENAKRALISASLYSINVDLAVINKVLPPDSTDEYYHNWAGFQRSKVDEAKANFYPVPVKEVQMHANELRGFYMLDRNAELLFGKDDPGDIFYRGKPITFKTESHTMRMSIKVPFTEKDDFDLERYGDQLSIKVKNPTGYLVNVIPLPIATMGMKLVKAKLQEDELNILFERNAP